MENAAFDAVEAMTDRMSFDSEQAKVDFIVKTQKGLATALHNGGDISDVLDGIPDAAIQAGMKALDRMNEAADRLVKLLASYLDDRKKKAAEALTSGLFKTDLLV